MKYSAEIERQMKTFYHSLSEKDRRRYAAVEATKLGHGGVQYLAALLECDPQTIAQGRKDLESPPDLPPGRVRQPGGGRKKALESIPDLEDHFLRVVTDHTAGDPMTPDVRWTNLTLQEIADRLRIGHTGQRDRGQAVTQEAQVCQTQGSEIPEHGSASRPQCPVREYRTPQEGIPGIGQSDFEHGHEEKGVAGQFLSRRIPFHSGSDRNLRS